MSSDECLIWSDNIANVRQKFTADRRVWYRVESPRSGGSYEVFDNVFSLKLQGLDDHKKARLTTLLVDWRNHHGEGLVPEVTPELIERACRTTPLSVYERAERLLRYVAKQSKAIGDTVNLNWEHAITSDTDRHAMAWSESTTLDEVQFLVAYLLQQGWIAKHQQGYYAVTVDGYRRIADIKENADSTQAFVAMWFDDDMNVAYEQGIEPAIRQSGYRSMRIDQKQDVVKIDDEIIGEIRRSRFLVADFTHGEDGARGGVYFEAGFAFGLGIPVIYTCREDAINKIHFDTRQYHHTAWKSPADLRDKLEKRILALIGEGPAISSWNQGR